MKRVIVEQYYLSTLTKKNRLIKRKFSEILKLYFNYSIEQFTTLKNLYLFLINVERIKIKQFVSMIKVLMFWKNRRKLSRTWFETKIFIRFDLVIIIINWLSLKKSERTQRTNLIKFDKLIKICNRKLMRWKQLTKQFYFNIENVYFAHFRLLKIHVMIFQL